MRCENCKSDTLRKFVCPDCSKNTNEKIRFYVCNEDCQRKFWIAHKESGHKQFPSFFSQVEIRSEDQDAAIEEALNQLQILRSMVSIDFQIDFENADLRDDKDWFFANWKSYKKPMVYHALCSFGAFQWKNFLGWMQAIAENDKAAMEATELFMNHPAFSA